MGYARSPAVLLSGLTATTMELFARVFVKLLNATYGKKPRPADEQRQPLVDDTLRHADEVIEGERRQKIVDSFKSTAIPYQGAIDYESFSWATFTRAVETPSQFTFYSARGIAKIIEKSSFTNPLELATFRRVIRRQIADCKLLPD